MNTLKKVVIMIRSGDQSVNAYTTHGLFDTNEDAHKFAQHDLGWHPNMYMVHDITIHTEESTDDRSSK